MILVNFLIKIEKIFVVTILLFCSLNCFSLPIVEVFGRNIYVNGKIFIVRGVCYSPTPIGKNPALGYTWWADKNYLSDIPKIKQLGANVIRTYSAPKSYNSNFKEFLDKCYDNGIYVIVGYWVNPDQNFANSNVRRKEKQNFINIVNQWKNHPAVIMWCFGNEVYPGGGSSWKDWYSLVQEVAQEVRNIDNNRLVMNVVNTKFFYDTVGKKDYKSDDESLSSLNCWGINAYLGYDFKNLFSDYKDRTSKPLIITEFGCDSWDGKNNKENEDMQTDYIISQWKDIERNLTLKNGVCSGGCVFEWSDEWWKSPNNSDTNHDTTPDWQNDNYVDPNINEEWFGIVKISSNTNYPYITTPKKVYYELQKLWSRYVNAERSYVYAYPNPAKNCEFVKFELLPYDTQQINIYNISGELVKVIKVNDLSDTKWYLDDNNFKKVASGVYIFTVKTKSGNFATNKIVVIK